MLLGVQHLVRDALLRELAREPLRLLDRDRADQHGLALLVALGDVVDRGRELRLLRLVDEVGVVGANHQPVRRDRHDLEVVGVRELPRLGGGRAGHAAELLVEAEVVLERDGREGLVLLFDLHVLLGLDGLVQTLAPAPALEDAAGELVDDLHLARLPCPTGPLAPALRRATHSRRSLLCVSPQGSVEDARHRGGVPRSSV